MSYEIVYKYHDRNENGEYDRSVLKEKVVKVGKVDEEVPLEEVAGRIIAQLARRNILIVNVEIYEFTKRKLSYVEVDDGIKIKGRKFAFDETAAISASEPENVQEQLLNVLQSNPGLVQQLLNTVKSSTSVNSPPSTMNFVRYEVFEPVDEAMLKVAAQKGWAFTRGKKYPIIKERPAGADPRTGMMYTTVDDNGKTMEINDKYFTVPPQLTGDFLEDQVQYVGGNSPEPQLSWDGAINDSMPDLRRR